MSIYDTLNSEQKKAVLQTDGPVLILAGAGSGKTRVLTHRIAYLIDECGVNPWNILAITFTNKAAGEMRERVDKIVGFGAESIWVATFHSTCVRILRRYADRIGYSNNFTIYDTDDSKSVLKDICKRYQLETTQLKLRNIQTAISHAKDNCVDANEYMLASGNDFKKQKIAKAYIEYQNTLKKNNAMDFDDLLLNTVKLFKDEPEVLAQYQERFRYIMVDEYQDTNNVQFEFVRLLADRYKNLCVVGDDDQSIYRFRGANIRNILDFEKVYPDATVIKLEQNYRSTQSILDAANAVIRNNYGRKDKALWTDEGKGELVRLKVVNQAPEEAEFIASEVCKLKKSGKADYKDIAVLYRTNAQSRLLEERFVYEGIPYDLVGGVNFYGRREIKDCLAYLKTIDSGVDDLAARRIINVPKRGIGATSITHVQEYADKANISFLKACAEADMIPGLNKTAQAKCKAFASMIGVFRAFAKEARLDQLMQHIIREIGYIDYLYTIDEDANTEDNEREQNVDELISKMAGYEEKEDEPTLTGFLEEVALVADIDNVSEDDDKVLLMTLHSAKGLEFDHVYLAGMEENVFPSFMALMDEGVDPEGLEEERRLAYVGITRARKHLTLTSARSRMTRGQLQYNPVSRFVTEIPAELLEKVGAAEASFMYDGGESIDDDDDIDLDTGRIFKKKMDFSKPTYAAGTANSPLKRSAYAGTKAATQPAYGRPVAKPAPPQKRAVPKDKPFIAGAASAHSKASLGKPGLAGLSKGMPTAGAALDYGVGDRVLHVKFGEGTVLDIVKEPRDYKVTIDFDDYGQKIMFAAFAKLKKV
ncbi:DNA helicase-2 / ATP-dependent DNA helicase PcrA [Butyrivibrio sp. ob235]|uniref:ATP-dependent helicase n=1 Tax=Butyrivibrio sp. ob235 TaxID=1761780 RepID=UPI0008CFF6C7|nr:UvrD-helicase domain-containing protein [Butyrivibrio sp. ob235]SEL41869.1 DNA helicase-2 / ATP-dependent DNA helicase PcrA [Butyrivibrio sp. ob235]